MDSYEIFSANFEYTRIDYLGYSYTFLILMIFNCGKILNSVMALFNSRLSMYATCVRTPYLYGYNNIVNGTY